MYKGTPFTRADKFTDLINRKVKYSDFRVNLDVHPHTGDLTRFVNEESVKKHLRNLILTDKYERPFLPSFGCNIRSLLFEPLDAQSLRVAEDLIREAIKEHIPYINVVYVSVIEEVTPSNAVRIDLAYHLLNVETIQKATIFLDRVR